MGASTRFVKPREQVARELVTKLTTSINEQELAASARLVNKVKPNTYRGSSK
jgi:hypothetical protein